MISSLKSQHRKKESKKEETALTAAAKHQAIGREPTNYDINNLLQDASTEKSTKNSRKNNSTSCRVIDESRPIEEHIQQTKWKQVTTEEIKENQQQTQRIKWKKATNESIKAQ